MKCPLLFAPFCHRNIPISAFSMTFFKSSFFGLIDSRKIIIPDEKSLRLTASTVASAPALHHTINAPKQKAQDCRHHANPMPSFFLSVIYFRIPYLEPNLYLPESLIPSACTSSAGSTSPEYRSPVSTLPRRPAYGHS